MTMQSTDRESKTARLAKYSAAAGAAGLMAGGAQATIVYSGVQNLDISQFSGTNLDLDAGGLTPDILLKNYVLPGGNYQGASVNYFPGKLIGFNNGLSYVSALSAGATIDATTLAGNSFFGSLAYGSNNPSAEFNNASGAFIGLEFPISGVSHFGWVRVDIDNAAGTFRIVDWAYEDEAGVGILTPEPGSLALLAAGAAGVAIRRRKKNTVA